MGSQQVPSSDRALTHDPDAIGADGAPGAGRAASAAFAAAAIWAVLVVLTGWRLGWLTPGIGLAVGAPLRKRVGGTAALALGLTLGAIVCGRGAAVVAGRWYVARHEVAVDPSLVFDAVAADLFPPTPPDDLFEPQLNAFEKMTRVKDAVSKMSEGEQLAAVRRYVGDTGGQVVRISPSRRFFAWQDLLWWPAALFFAFRLGKGRPVQRQLGLVETPVAEFMKDRPA